MNANRFKRASKELSLAARVAGYKWDCTHYHTDDDRMLRARRFVTRTPEGVEGMVGVERGDFNTDPLPYPYNSKDEGKPICSAPLVIEIQEWLIQEHSIFTFFNPNHKCLTYMRQGSNYSLHISNEKIKGRDSITEHGLIYLLENVVEKKA